jgi:hypothetical protein
MVASFDIVRSLRCKTQHSPIMKHDEDSSPRARGQRRTLGRGLPDARPRSKGSPIDANPAYVEVITQECDGTPLP